MCASLLSKEPGPQIWRAKEYPKFILHCSKLLVDISATIVHFSTSLHVVVQTLADAIEVAHC